MTGKDMVREAEISAASAVRSGSGLLERKAQRALRRAQDLLGDSSGMAGDVFGATNCGKLTRLIRYMNRSAEGDAGSEPKTEFPSLKSGR
ncbi:MAG TPA: hypothetical protein PKA10_16345 [Selenomonadales bacterium]|nr:hypothetical protein [Selenomonadales bacterium]